jgi:hypothetical protein
LVGVGDQMITMGGAFSNFQSGILRGGTYNVAGTLEIEQLGSGGGEIVTNAAAIVLNGTGSAILDGAGLDALTNLAANGATASFTVMGGRNVTTSGRFSNAGNFTVGSGSTFTVGGPGIFIQTAGTTTDNGTLTVSGGVRLSGGSLLGVGTVSGNLQSSGIITPGKSASTTGIMTESGSYVQSGTGSLDIAIGGAKVGTNYDQLKATTATLGGNLNLSLINGYVPAVGSTYKIVSFTSGSGQFSNVSGLAINSTEHFAINYQASDVLLTVVSGADAITPSRVVSDMFIRKSFAGPMLASRSLAVAASVAEPWARFEPSKFARIPMLPPGALARGTVASLPLPHLPSIGHPRQAGRTTRGSLQVSLSSLFSKPHLSVSIN